MPGEDVKVSIGANISPFQQKMAEVQALAKQSGSRIGESLGLEGLKGERGLKTQIQGFFKDIAGGADVATAATSRLSESFRMGTGALIAVAAVQYLYGAMQKGVEIAGKFQEAVKASLSISGNNSNKSQEQMEDEIAKLKQAIKDTDLASMTRLEAGSTILVQALEKGESLSQVINEDAQKHFDLVQQEHAEQDAAATQTIDQQNEILRLKIAGNSEAAEQLQDEFNDRNRLLELQRQGDKEAIAALQTQIDLKKKLRDEGKATAQKKELTTVQGQIDAELSRQGEIGKTPAEKLADAKAKVAADQARITAAAAAGVPHSEADVRAGLLNDALSGNSSQTRLIDAKKAELALEKDITAEKELQADIDRTNADAAKSAADQEANRVKEALEKQRDLKADIAEVGLTGEQKSAELRTKIQAEEKAYGNSFVGPRQKSESLRQQLKILEDQLALKKQDVENDRKTAEQKRGEVSSDRRVGLGDASATRSSTHHSMDELVGSTVISRSRLNAFGRYGSSTSAEAGSKENTKMLAGKLDNVYAELKILNEKIGGTV